MIMNDVVSGVGGWGVMISLNLDCLASMGENIEFWEKWFFPTISAHSYVTFKPNLYLCWSVPLTGDIIRENRVTRGE